MRRTGTSQRRPSSRARASAGWWPRPRRRSGSGGTNTSGSPPCSSASAVTAAAALERRRRPRSFHACTRRRTDSSYATAERARAKASRRPAHSRQRRTGQAVGAQHRSQRGPPSRGSAPTQLSQTCAPGRPQATQRCGSRRSRRLGATGRRYERQASSGRAVERSSRCGHEPARSRAVVTSAPPVASPPWAAGSDPTQCEGGGAPAAVSSARTRLAGTDRPGFGHGCPLRGAAPGRRCRATRR